MVRKLKCETLKPCPFCSGELYFIEDEEVGEDLITYRVICDCCLASGPSGGSERDAIAEWNMRDGIVSE